MQFDASDAPCDVVTGADAYGVSPWSDADGAPLPDASDAPHDGANEQAAAACSELGGETFCLAEVA